jgi:hypothetical protein
VKEGGWNFLGGNVEDGLSFTVLLDVVEGEVEHPLNIVSVCCKFVLNWVAG